MHHTHGVAGSSPVVSTFYENKLNIIRPHGQAVKTTPSHGVNSGSIPDEVIEIAGIECEILYLLFFSNHRQSAWIFVVIIHAISSEVSWPGKRLGKIHTYHPY